eukprot:6708020-Prymnesium_polylepis.2
MDSSNMQHYMQDSRKMFKVYKRIGGGSAFDKYKQDPKLFYYHTLNSLVFGVGPESYDGASSDGHGFALHSSRYAAEDALVDEAKIDRNEVCLIFRSVDAVHAYT